MKQILLGLLSGMTLVLAGCGNQTTQDVTGMVTVNGVALAEGYIAFVPQEVGGTGGGGAINNGQFKVRVPLGKHRVEISASKKIALPYGQEGMYGETEEVQQFLPAYNAKSQLEAEVTNDTSPLEFHLWTD